MILHIIHIAMITCAVAQNDLLAKPIVSTSRNRHGDHFCVSSFSYTAKAIAWARAVRINPCCSNSNTCFKSEGKTGEGHNLVIFENFPINKRIESSRRDLSIDMVVHWFIFETNQITIMPCFTFLYLKQVKDYLKQVKDYLKQGLVCTAASPSPAPFFVGSIRTLMLNVDSRET